MNKYNDLEMSILSCIIQKPELMDKNMLDDKYFVKHKKLWLFMKTFYKRFGNFDFTLMMNVCNNRYQMIDYIISLAEKEPAPSLFEIYQQLLIDEYNKTKKEKFMISKIYELVNELYVGEFDTIEFKNKLDQLYEDSKIMSEEMK